MAERIVQEESLTTVADAIRAKGGTTDALSFPTGFADAISAIQAGGGGGEGGEDNTLNALIDESITEITSNVETVGKYTFYGRTSLETANFPNAKKIAIYAFSGCTSLKTVNAPEVTSYALYAFNGCSSLTEMKMNPNATTVGQYAFYNCSSLRKVEFPLKTSFIYDRTFSDCTSLIAFILRKKTVQTLNSNTAFTSTPIKSGTGYIYVPSALIDSYKTASYWSALASQFRALEDYTVDGTITGELDESKI